MEREKEQTVREDLLAGRNAVHEAIKAGRPIDSVLVARGERQGSIRVLLALCKERGILVKEVDPRKLDALCGPQHQGIVALMACAAAATLEDLFAAAESRGEKPLFVVCDEIEDPHNLGAIARSAEAAGAHGLIVPQRRSAPLTAAAYKASAGALVHLPVARVVNLSQTLKTLKKRGVWIYGLDMDGAPWCGADLGEATALVVGSEGKGLGRLIREQCDGLLSLPMRGQISSLNASVACGIVLFEVARQRLGMHAR